MNRRHDLDWLRVLLFGLLVLHHVAVGFAPFGEAIYGFANDEVAGPLLSLAIYWSHGWRLPALFLVAGIGAWLAVERGARRDAAGPGGRSGAVSRGLLRLGRRLARLLVPLVAGALLLNPIAGAAITAMTGEPRGFLSFPESWWLPVAPSQVMHLWFLGNLALYTALAWPVLMFAARLPGRGPSMSPPLLLAALALGATVVAALAKPWGAAIAGDGYQLYWYGAIFAGGCMIGARHETVLEWASRRAWWMLALGLALFSAEVALIETTRPVSDSLAEALASGGWATLGLAPAYGPRGLAFAVVEGLGAWAWSIAALGFCARWLRRGGPWLRSLAPAVFPIYVFHFPVVIVELALLAQVSWPWPLEFLLLTGATYGLSAAGWVAVRRAGWLGWMFGGPGPVATPGRGDGVTPPPAP